MRRYLVVANQTLASGELTEEIRKWSAVGPCSFYIVVPATPPKDQLTWTEGEATAIARDRLDRALTRLRELEVEADGDVGDPNPLQAIAEVLQDSSFDEIVLSTLPPGISKWLGQDLPHRVQRKFDLPVTHVIGQPD